MLVSSVQQSDSVMCVCVCVLYTNTFFFRFFSIVGITRYWVEFPVLYSRFLLFINFTYSSVYMLIPNP